MPYPPEHKVRTRAKIVESARVLFNRRGFEQVTIDDVMQHAGLTRGAFYHHFETKDELYAEAVRSFITCNPFAKNIPSSGQPPDPRVLARALVDLYLADATLADVDHHCPLIALPSDVARSGLKPRAAYTELVESLSHVFLGAFDQEDVEAAHKAHLIVTLCVGGMVLARTIDDPKLQTTLRATARAEALTLLEGPTNHRLDDASARRT
jgi:TetR/AcrR family transcriptional regulator, transcriptional repressor for nem operon